MEMTWLGDLDPALLQNYFGELRTTEVVVTEERIAHIRERHPEDFALFVQYGAETVLSPDLLILDEKHRHDVLSSAGQEFEKTAGKEPIALQSGIIVVYYA